MRVDLPLVRKSDKRNVGELTLIRTLDWHFADEEGRRLASPKREDTLLVSLKNTAGDEICWFQVPMDALQLDS